MHLLSLDIETTGLDQYDQILEIGAIAVDDAGHELGTFHCYLRHGRLSGDPVALAMNDRIIRILAGVSVPDAPVYAPEDAAKYFHEWLERYAGQEQKFTVTGKNAGGFDIPMINRLFESHLPWVDNQKPHDYFHHRVLDLGPLYWNPARDGWVVPSLKGILDQLGRRPTGLHTALGDARDVLIALQEKVKRF